MKKKIYQMLALCSLLYCAIPNVCFAESVKISGHISKSYIETYFHDDQPFITYYDHYNQEDPSNAQIIPLNIKNGSFSVTIELKGPVGYFSLQKGSLNSINDGYFIIQRGDEIGMEVESPQKVRFTGKGADKLNYQHWAWRLLLIDQKNWTKEDKWQNMMVSYKKRTNKILAIALDSLNRDKNIDHDSIKDIIRLNLTSAVNWDYVSNIYKFEYLSDTAYSAYVKQEINYQITQQNGLQPSDPFLIKNAFVYTHYLFYLNGIVASIRSRQYRPPFNLVYNNLKTEYEGAIRDEVLPYCFLQMLKRSPEAIQSFDEAIGLVRDSDNRAIIERVKTAKGIGARAFNFDLETSSTKRLRLNDLKGKIVVLDTYYNGCVHCVELSNAMRPIEEYFSGKNDIIFVSFDGVAHSFEDFIKGVRTGHYGLKKSIYAWTGGLGEQHPLLKYYQYTSYPNLLIIGKDGKVISANPEKPLTDSSRKNFITLIEKNL
ncbi:TlpA family protein disulfide reductase [Mucilaginibacter sp. UYCu711]|uniref:TlpA family protein disulfide reductase n=1 Tax=Mucilaginibacter sp. UYCu711 TaxID=3156339 RepID=UPI003D1D9154